MLSGHTAPIATDEAYAAIAESGIEYIILYPTNAVGAGDENFYTKPFQLADKYDVKILVYTNNLNYDFTKSTVYNYAGKPFCQYWAETYPNVFGGIIVWDEPTAGTLSEMKTIHDKIKAFADAYVTLCPGFPYYVNLNPIYANVDTQLGDMQYEEYVAYFSDVLYQPTVGDALLWCDIYPLYTAGTEMRSDWLKNLEILRAEAEQQNADLNMYIQSIGWGTHRSPSEADLRFQAYVSLAYGAVGISYFTYQTPTENSTFQNSAGLVDKDGNTTEIYGYAQKVNAELKQLDGAYLAFDWKAVVKSGNCSNFTNCSNLKTSYGGLTGVSSTREAIVGCFTNEQGYEGFMAVNFTDPIKGTGNVVTLKFDSKYTKAIVYVKGVATEMDIVNGELVVNLEAGEGKFIVPYAM